MVGAANSDSARISFFGSTKRELAQKLDRGQDAVGRRRLTQVPPEPREMVAYYTAHNLCLGYGGTYSSSAVGRTRGATWISYRVQWNPAPLSSPKERRARGNDNDDCSDLYRRVFPRFHSSVASDIHFLF